MDGWACPVFCVSVLQVGVDSVGVGGGELGQGLVPVGGDLSFDELALGPALGWTARCFSDTACLGFQAALVKPRNSCSTSLGVRYPRAE